MAPPLRFIRPKTMYEVVVRTVDGRLLLRPDAAFTKRLLGAIGHALSYYAVALHAFVFLSNHGHVMATSETGESFVRFFQMLNRNIAEAVRSLRGWSGQVLVRYRPIPILDDLAALRRLRYLLSNSVKEGLVAHPLEWPGASTARALQTGEPIETDWPVRTRGRRRSDARELERNVIQLEPLPCWAQLSPDERRKRVTTLMDDVAEEARVLRGGRPALGIEALLAANPETPIDLEWEPAPVAHFSDKATLAAYLADEQAFKSTYRAAAAAQRAHHVPSDFPLHGFPSPMPFRAE